MAQGGLDVRRASALAACIAVGCRRQTTSSPPSQRGDSIRSESSTDVLFNAIDVLRGQEESGTPESLNSVLARLNQWVAAQSPPPDWKPDALIASLPTELRELPAIGSLADLRFSQADGHELRQVVWLREISERTAGAQSDPLQRATRLFDWTVRNIQLDAPSGTDLPHSPSEILLLGRGSVSDRAWIFILLARQQGLDAVMLAKPPSDQQKAGQELLPALLVGGELYLFDPSLGLPLPGPGGRGVATLSQVAGDDALLRRLDLDPDHAYPLKSADFQQVVALVEASPFYLAQRSQLVESALSGKQQLALAVHPSKLAERLKSARHLGEVGLWLLPYQRMVRHARPSKNVVGAMRTEMRPFMIGIPPFPVDAATLRKARVLHLLGKHTGADGAIAAYQHARPPQRELQAMLNDQRVPAANRPQVEAIVGVMQTAKDDASYWLGLIALERKDYETAIDYFQKRTLDARPKGPWTAGARYNLGRTYEAMGKMDEAVHQYEAGQSPQRHGNLLRARWLKERAATKSTAPSGGTP